MRRWVLAATPVLVGLGTTPPKENVQDFPGGQVAPGGDVDAPEGPQAAPIDGREGDTVTLQVGTGGQGRAVKAALGAHSFR